MNSIICEMLQCMDSVTLEECKHVSVKSRKETKYVCEKESYLANALLQLRGWCVLDIDGERILEYKTTYYDTDDMRAYRDLTAKTDFRQKIRIREYGTGQKFLEIKEKKSGITKKYRKEITTPELDVEWLREKCAYAADSLRAATMTRYRRITLVNKERTARITIDTDIEYRNLRTDERKNLKFAIVELKCGNERKAVTEMLARLNIGKVKYSKYRESVEMNGSKSKS